MIDDDYPDEIDQSIFGGGDLAGLQDFVVPRHIDPLALHRGHALQITLPDGWTPGAAPGVDLVRAGAAQGLGLVVNPDIPFDFRWLGDAVPSLGSLSCWGDWDRFEGVDLVPEMASIRSLHLPGSDRELTLDHLDELELVSIGGSGFLSALRAPNVRGVTLHRHGVKRTPVPFDWLPEMLDWLRLDVGAVDVSRLREFQRLLYLTLEGMPKVDLGFVAELPELEKLEVLNARRVVGVAALLRAPSLRDVVFSRVSEIDDIWSLLDLRVEWFRGSGAAFTSEFVEATEGLPGWWGIEASRRTARPAESSPLSVVAGQDGTFEIQFTDFDIFGALDEDADVTSDDIEHFWSWYLRETRPREMNSGEVQFDSEAESVNVICDSRRVAHTVKAALENLTNVEGARDRAISSYLAQPQ